jgi:peptidyl-prolyl cis-trans isomerase SurA
MRRWVASVAVLALAGTTARATAQDPARVLERVVAVVGDDPILLTELRKHARPYVEVWKESHPEAGSADEGDIYKEILQLMIDTRFIEEEAARSGIKVTLAEIAERIRTTAQRHSLTVPEYLAAARKGGWTDNDLREEVRREVLEQKVLALRVVPRIPNYEALSEDVRKERMQTERRKWLDEVEVDTYVDVRL